MSDEQQLCRQMRLGIHCMRSKKTQYKLDPLRFINSRV